MNTPVADPISGASEAPAIAAIDVAIGTGEDLDMMSSEARPDPAGASKTIAAMIDIAIGVGKAMDIMSTKVMAGVVDRVATDEPAAQVAAGETVS
jgi:hypothetical protein